MARDQHNAVSSTLNNFNHSSSTSSVREYFGDKADDASDIDEIQIKKT